MTLERWASTRMVLTLKSCRDSTVFQICGLNTHIAASILKYLINHKDIIRQILTVRKTFRKDFAKDLAEFIEFYDPDNYLYHASVAENILFGDHSDDAFYTGNLPQLEKMTQNSLPEGISLEKIISMVDGHH
jgi:hypothetical protein